MAKPNPPDSWATCKVGDVVELKNGYAFKSGEFISRGIEVIRISNIQDGEIDLADAVHVKDHPDYHKFSVEKGDLLIAMSGATTGKMGVYNHEGVAFQNQRVGNIKVKSEAVIYPSFRNHFFRMKQEDILKEAYGGAQPNISGTMIENFDFALPPLSEQKRIVAKIQSTQEKIKAIEENASKAEELIGKYRESLLQKAFRGQLVPQDPNDEPASELLKRIRAERAQATDSKKKKKEDLPLISKEEEVPFEIPRSWEWIRLGDISSQIQYGFTASSASKGTHKFLRITDIKPDGVDWDSVPFCTIDKKEADELKLLKGDILFARTGGTVGKSYLVNNSPKDAVFASYLIKVRPKNATIDPTFLMFYFNSPTYWDFVTEKQRGAAQPNINGTTLSHLLIPVPPLNEQKKISSILDNLSKKIQASYEQIADLMKLKLQMESAILEAAFSGKLVSQDLSEGTGHELLEIIDRAASINEAKPIKKIKTRKVNPKNPVNKKVKK